MKKLSLINIGLCILLINLYAFAKVRFSVNSIPQMKTSIDMKSTATISNLATELDVVSGMTSHFTDIKQNLQLVLEKFKKSPDYSEAKVQKIMELIDIELKIVDRLSSSSTRGALLENTIRMRNDLLQTTLPSLVGIYNKIMDSVTYNDSVNRKLFQSRASGYDLAFVLPAQERISFLSCMKDKLLHYHNIFEQMQHDFILESQTTNDSTAIDAHGSYVNFCPVVR